MGDRQQLDNERRVAMRREHAIIGGGAPLPPFAENLVFWASLTEGDLTDHVSSLVPNGQGTATWDAQKSMYLLDSTQNNQWKAALRYTKNGGFPINSIDGHSIYLRIQLISNTTDYEVFAACTSIYIRNNGWSSLKECFGYINQVVSGVQVDGQTHSVCFTAKAGEWKCYTDGLLVYTGQGYTAAQQENPPTQLDVCATNTGSNRRIKLYARDVRLYNRILTASEVAQL